MKPSFFITLILLSVAGISTASILFLDGAPKPSTPRSSTPAAVEIKWGEGSEAGTPSNAVNK